MLVYFCPPEGGLSQSTFLGDVPISNSPYFETDAGKSAKIQLYHEDCISGLRSRIKPGSIDVIITSPPYNIGAKYGRYRDNLPEEEYLSWMDQVVQELKRVMHPKSSFFLNMGGKPTNPWLPLDVARRVRKHLTLQNTIHWVKSIAIRREDVGEAVAITDDIAVGHYKPIIGERFLNDCHEYIFHFTMDGTVRLDRLSIGIPYQDKSNIRRWSPKRDKRCGGNTWFIPYETISNREKQRPHPSSYPIRLPEMCLRLHGLDQTNMVLDPFIGIGSTAVACLKLGISCIGFEIDDNYLGVSSERIKKVNLEQSKH